MLLQLFKETQVVMVFTLVSINYSFGNVYYVDTNGNDSNSGSLTQPWKTLTYASTIASPGDTVYVKAGLYTENVVFSKNGTTNSPIVFLGYKTTPGDQPPLLVNDSTFPSAFNSMDMPTFIGINRSFGIGFNCQNRRFLVIKNFQIQNYAYGFLAGGTSQDAGNLVLENINVMSVGDISSSSYSGFGFLFGSMGTRFSNNNTISNCLVINAAAEGFGINGNNNLIVNCKAYCNENSGSAATDYYMIVTGNDNVFRNCYIERMPGLSHNGHGYTAKTNAEQVIDRGMSVPAISAQHNKFYYCIAKNMGEAFCVRHRTAQYNLFYHCKAIGTHTGEPGSSGGEGHCMVSRDGASDNIFDGCIAENCRSAIKFNDTVEDGDTGADPAGHPGNNNLFINCIAVNCYMGIYYFSYSIPSDAGNNIIANCTFYKTRYQLFAERSCKNMKYINNIFYGTLSSGSGGAFKAGPFADDIIPNGTNTYFSNCDFFNIEGGMPLNFVTNAINSFSADPLFKNINIGDFHLQPGSPCINTGKSLDYVKTDFDSIPRPQGESYEIGAYESQLVTSIPYVPDRSSIIRIFPNPASDVLNIQTSVPGCKITMYNMAGNIVRMIHAVSDKIEIKLGSLSNGIYALRTQSKTSLEKAMVFICK